MKTKLFTLFTVLMLFQISNKMFGQDFISKKAEKEAQTAHLKNSVITIDNKSFDYRVLKHYSEQELRNMSSVKRNQVHFIYTQSYHVIDLVSTPFSELDINWI
jgi:hypothetical protein